MNLYAIEYNILVDFHVFKDNNKNMDKNNVIATFVKSKRKELHLTQEQLAIMSGVALSFLRALEQGKMTLKVSNVNKVLNILGYELGPFEVKRR